MTVKINNLPNHVENYKYIVTRLVDTELWFWGAWNSKDKATEAAREVGGLVVLND